MEMETVQVKNFKKIRKLFMHMFQNIPHLFEQNIQFGNI